MTGASARSTDPASWPRSGWCWGCGPTKKRIAPAEISGLESCVDHLPPGWQRSDDEQHREDR